VRFVIVIVSTSAIIPTNKYGGSNGAPYDRGTH
jgi:hypothetical protein